MLALFVGACSNQDLLPEVGNQTNPEATSGTLTLKATMPGEKGTSTRVSAEELDGGAITLTWEANDTFEALFLQGDKDAVRSLAVVQTITDGGKNATFTINIPEAIDTTEPYNLIGVYGGEGEIANGQIKVPTYIQNDGDHVGKNIMLRFKQAVPANATTIGNVDFEHLGFLLTAKIKVADNDFTRFQNVKLHGPFEYFLPKNLFLNVADDAIAFVEEGEDKDVANLIFNETEGDILTVRNWFPATTEEWPAVNLAFWDGATNTLTANTKPARTPEIGNAYYMYALLDGDNFVFTGSDFTPPVISEVFEVDKTDITLPAVWMLTSTVKLTTNDDQAWTATTNADWLKFKVDDETTIDELNGTGTMDVTLTASENTDGERTATVTFTPTGPTELSPITVTVKQVGTNIDIYELYVPGSYQGETWDPATARTLYNRNFDFVFNGFIHFPANGNFKLTKFKEWSVQWGYKSNGELKQDGVDIPVGNSSEGLYYINADNFTTYSIHRAEVWSIIGSAVGGWDVDVAMSRTETGLYTATNIELQPGEFKFRAENEWNLDLGGNINDLARYGTNITVTEAGTYTITLDIRNNKQFKCTIEKQ